jgi:hypothetical protein
METDARQQIVDGEHLRLLRIGYLIAAGMTTLVSVFFLIYSFAGFFIFSRLTQGSGEGGPPEFVGRLIGFLGLGLTFVILSIAAMQFLTAQRLKERRSRVFCMVIAGITCLSIPYGTFLGVCTFVVLGRPFVRNLFEERSS